jgi:GR25 family glycosyltransferase involved in LPS biosynthesis
MNNIPVYILSLNYRTDRQKKISDELIVRGVPFEFIISTKQENENYEALPLANQTEVAIWSSHVKAMEKLVSSGNNWGLILEDDAVILQTSRSLFSFQTRIFINKLDDKFGIIQLGWVPNSNKQGIQAFVAKIIRALFGLNRFDLKSKISFILDSGYLEFQRISRQIRRETQLDLIPLFGMRLGAHAYLIHKDTAMKLIQRFENRKDIANFKTIDQDLLELTINPKKNTGFKAVRFNKNLIEQSQVDSDNKEKTVY